MSEDWTDLSADALDVAKAVAFVADPRAGGIDVFLGTTRAESRRDGVELVALDYEAYPDMARKQLQQLALRVRDRWPVVKAALLHRTGRVAVGEPSVVIAVSTPHRAEAFDACRWLIDTLKAELTVWKQEVWADSGVTWTKANREWGGGEKSG
jgi:molybdopterin synthase catalytic subunit